MKHVFDLGNYEDKDGDIHIGNFANIKITTNEIVCHSNFQ